MILSFLSKYKYVVIGVVVILLTVGSFIGGYRAASAGCEKDKREALEALIEYQNRVQSENDKINQEIINDLQKNQWKVRTEIKEVIKYVENNDNLNDCRIDDDGLQLWNGQGSD